MNDNRGIGTIAGALAALGLSMSAAGCFDGRAALGYPCNRDSDCGPELSCSDQGCCGGECKFGEPSTGAMTTEGSSSTTNPSTSSSTASTTTTTTTTTTNAESTSTTTPAECGDGNLDPGEECDPPEGVDENGPCPGCQNAACGDGLVHEGEEDCDLGDGQNGGRFDQCSTQCRAPIFYWDTSLDTAGEFCVPANDCGFSGLAEGWSRLEIGAPYSNRGPHNTASGSQTLKTRAFEIPSDGNVAIRLRHEARFQVCMIGDDPPDVRDYGRVYLESADNPASRAKLFPFGNETAQQPVKCFDACANPDCNAIEGEMGFGQTDGVVTADVPNDAVRAALEGVQQGPVKLVLEASFDCSFCGQDPPQDPEWEIHQLVVSYQP